MDKLQFLTVLVLLTKRWNYGINIGKTKLLVQTVRKDITCVTPIQIQGTDMEAVESFPYLGSITKSGLLDVEIEHRYMCSYLESEFLIGFIDCHNTRGI